MEKLTWLRDHAGAWFATFWIVLALYALGGYLVWAFLQLDAQFSRPLAGGVIPADVTQQVAWGTRMFSVIAGAMAIYFHLNDMKRWSWTFTVMTFVAALILLLHAYGVAAKIMQQQYANDAAIVEIATVNTDAIEQQIDDLQQERDDLRADTQLTINTLQRSIDNVTTDGLDNDQLADAYRADQAQALAARDAQLREITTVLSDLRAEARSVSSGATADAAQSDSFNPLFTFLARLSSGVWDPAADPSNVHKFAWGIAFFTLFFGFGEILMMVSFTGGYAALKVVSERKLKSRSELEAENEFLRRSNAAYKGKQKDKPEKPIPIEDNGYVEEQIPLMVRAAERRKAKNQEVTQYVANMYFCPRDQAQGNTNELRNWLNVQLRRNAKIRDPYFEGGGKAPLIPFTRDMYNLIMDESMPVNAVNGHDKSEDPIIGADDESADTGDQPNQAV